jgi:hypothetical protein
MSSHNVIFVTKFIPTIDLVLIEGEARHVGKGEAANVAHWTANAAANVEDFVSIRAANEAKLAGEVVLMAADGFAEGFKGIAVGKVEGGTPTPFVKQSGKIVVTVDESLVFCISSFFVIFLMKFEVAINARVDIRRGLEFSLLYERIFIMRCSEYMLRSVNHRKRRLIRIRECNVYSLLLYRRLMPSSLVRRTQTIGHIVRTCRFNCFNSVMQRPTGSMGVTSWRMAKVAVAPRASSLAPNEIRNVDMAQLCIQFVLALDIYALKIRAVPACMDYSQSA